MLASGLDEYVDDAEKLARFVDESGKKNAAGATWRAFVPPRSGELSTARCSSDLDELKRLAQLYLGHCKTLGAAIFAANAAREIGLTVTASEPPEKHCNISGWPSDQADEDKQKEKRKEAAMKLNSKVTEWVPFI